MAKKRLGIFGGTFDPPHIGHLILAAEARDQLDLDCTIWVLTPDPPHKQGQEISSLAHRLAMVEMAIGEDERFALSRVDIDRPGPHYALDTVRLLRAEYPDHELYYLMGGDSLMDLPQWHEPKAFLSQLDGVGVMSRPGDEIDLSELLTALPSLSEKLHFVTAPLLEIAANQVRRRVKENRAYRYYVLPVIYRYILEHGIYQD
ncbi:MAG: nicotinate-nucleotide adenylyltransferase [Chloroflexota bacterium]|nr:nicotinate-nucleotide adenylyltransferase [Chloroflexota bacterium]